MEDEPERPDYERIESDLGFGNIGEARRILLQRALWLEEQHEHRQDFLELAVKSWKEEAEDFERDAQKWKRAYQAALIAADCGLKHALMLQMDTPEDENARRLLVETIRTVISTAKRLEGSLV